MHHGNAVNVSVSLREDTWTAHIIIKTCIYCYFFAGVTQATLGVFRFGRSSLVELAAIVIATGFLAFLLITKYIVLCLELKGYIH
ncbi:hypothetical protein L2E82_29488 [Cichorium intybus]|uniref:Uncharacterized protein n=1 Tax=Cichorium intybus TaxID=13427 RepID=A0ACB9CXW9_CICIN|nr:hypothetical protein L2E82_29488 [Cichorium intybus]